MTCINDGGPAYPCTTYPQSAEQVREIKNEAGIGLMDAKKWASTHGGMTLRDWFAGQVLCSVGFHHVIAPHEATLAAESAYRVADAMLAARNNNTTDK